MGHTGFMLKGAKSQNSIVVQYSLRRFGSYNSLQALCKSCLEDLLVYCIPSMGLITNYRIFGSLKAAVLESVLKCY